MLTGLCQLVRVGPVDTTPPRSGVTAPLTLLLSLGPPLPQRDMSVSARVSTVLSGPGVLSEDPPGPVRESREALTILPNRSGGCGSKASFRLSCGGSLGWLSYRTGWPGGSGASIWAVLIILPAQTLHWPVSGVSRTSRPVPGSIGAWPLGMSQATPLPPSCRMFLRAGALPRVGSAPGVVSSAR